MSLVNLVKKENVLKKQLKYLRKIAFNLIVGSIFDLENKVLKNTSLLFLKLQTKFLVFNPTINIFQLNWKVYVF